MRTILLSTLSSILFGVACAASAQTAPDAPSSAAVPTAQTTASQPAPSSSITTLETISVVGVLPGPGLWKVADKNGHVLWVLGVIQSLPGGMQWRSSQVAQTIATSQEVIAPPTIKLKLDTNFFGKLFLLPSVYSARKNEDGKTLKDVLPAPLYARWLVLKRQYIGDDDGIERWRPIFAAMELYKKALRKNGLRGNGQIDDTVDAMAKQHGLAPTSTVYTLEVTQPRQAVKAFAASGPDGVACFAHTLDAIEHDIPMMRARANAWATGDIATLRKLPDSHFRDVCKSALTGAGFARQLGISNLPAQIETHWLNVATGALARNAQSFAVLPMDQVMDADGYLAALKARGYTVQSPDELEAAAASAASAATP